MDPEYSVCGNTWFASATQEKSIARRARKRCLSLCALVRMVLRSAGGCATAGRLTCITGLFAALKGAYVPHSLSSGTAGPGPARGEGG